MAGGALVLGGLSIEGYSRAGEESWYRVRPPGLGFDAGRGAAALVGARDLFLTHGHLDHALGVPWVLSQRRLQGLGPARVWCPAPVAGALAEFLAAAGRLEEVDYGAEVRGLAPGERVELERGFAVEAFAVDHIVAALGYHLLRRHKRLRAELRELPGEEIARLRRDGREVEEAFDEIALSYCGDTGPGVFELAPRLRQSRVLLLECTFLGEATRGRGTLYGHLHLDDLAEHAALLSDCEAIVLTHLSRRHTRDQLAREVARHLPGLADRVHLFGAEAA